MKSIPIPTWETLRLVNLGTGVACTALAISDGPSWLAVANAALAGAAFASAYFITITMKMRADFSTMKDCFDQLIDVNAKLATDKFERRTAAARTDTPPLDPS